MLNKWITNFTLLLFFAIICFANISAVNNHALSIRPLAPFSSLELENIKQYIFNNITTEEHEVIKNDKGKIIHSIPGAVLASQSNGGEGFVQDYQFHWVRDAALTMREIVYLYMQASDTEKIKIKPYLYNYINFEKKAQKQISLSGEITLGQPKYNIDGSIWEGKWTRPQNDGAALRSITMVAIAELLLQEGEEKYVRDVLINMIKTDLDYVVSAWQMPNYDLWEEVKDDSLFFTKMVQRKALLEGAAFCKRMGEVKYSDNYIYIANQLTKSLNKHWHEGRGFFTESLSQQYIKGGGVNTSIILGVLHGDISDPDDPFAVNNERVMSSVYYIRNAFSGLYRINIDNQYNPPLLGRYPNDIYDGDQENYGNPWILTTNALAQYYYTLANFYLKQREITITKVNKLFFTQIGYKVDGDEDIKLTDNTQKFYTIVNALIEEGDKALDTVKLYSKCYSAVSCLHFSEQVDRTSGEQTSAKDLTWNYVSLLSAMQTRVK